MMRHQASLFCINWLTSLLNIDQIREYCLNKKAATEGGQSGAAKAAPGAAPKAAPGAVPKAAPAAPAAKGKDDGKK